MMIKVTDAELIEAIKQNDIATVCKLLDDVGILKAKGRIPYDENIRQILQIILTAASAVAFTSKLSSELTEELIARVAPCCQLFLFLRFMMLTTETEANDCSAIPNEIKNYISHGTSLNSELMQRIENLDATEIRALLSWVLGDDSPPEIPIAFNMPIMICAYKNELIPTGNFLAFMAGSLSEVPCVDPLTALAHLFS